MVDHEPKESVSERLRRQAKSKAEARAWAVRNAPWRSNRVGGRCWTCRVNGVDACAECGCCISCCGCAAREQSMEEDHENP